jgi:hypothetical protein
MYTNKIGVLEFKYNVYHSSLLVHIDIQLITDKLQTFVKSWNV